MSKRFNIASRWILLWVLISGASGWCGAATAEPVDVRLAPNASWVWHTDPVTIWNDGRLFFSYADSERKEIVLSSYDPADGAVRPIDLSTEASVYKDDHDHPAITVLPDSTLYLAYSRHGGDRGFFYRRSIVPIPESLEQLTEERKLEWPQGGSSCYNNLYYLAEEKRLYRFTRWLQWKPTWQASEDLGETWTDPEIVIMNSPGRPYVHYASNNRDRIDMIYSDGHPRNKTNSIYHIFYQSGAFCTSDGALLKKADDLPIQNDEQPGTAVYGYSEKPWGEGEGIHDWIPGGRAWVWDLEYDRSGNPVCVFSVRVSGPEGEPLLGGRIYYYYAWWTPQKGWQKRCIAKAGNPLYESENDFAGGICLDPKNPSIVYFSSNAAKPFDLATLETPLAGENDYKLYRGVFDRERGEMDGGTFYEKPGQMAVRPFVPSGEGPVNAVLWMEGPEYQNMKTFPTYLMGRFWKEDKAGE
jgi:hypothetical protein